MKVELAIPNSERLGLHFNQSVSSTSGMPVAHSPKQAECVCEACTFQCRLRVEDPTSTAFDLLAVGPDESKFTGLIMEQATVSGSGPFLSRIMFHHTDFTGFI